MECRDIREKLSAYADDALSPGEKTTVAEHLKSCGECSAALAEIKKVIEHAGNVEAVEPPSWMTQKIMAKIREEARPEKGILQRLFYPLHIKLPIEAVAVVLVVGLALYIYRDINPEMKLAQAPAGKSAPQILQREIIKEDKIGPFAKSDEGRAPQEVVTAPEKASKEPVVGKMEEKASKIKTESANKAQPERQELPGPPAPAKERDGIQAAGALAKGEARQEARAAAPKAKLAYMEKKDEKALGLTIVVNDPEAVVREIEKILSELEGKTIRTESVGEKKIMTAEINAVRLRALIEKLKLVGQVKEKDVDEAMKGELLVRIEIVKNPRSD